MPGTGTVGGVKIKAVERDARGNTVGTFAPARNQAEIAACRASAEAVTDQNDQQDEKPQSEVPPPAPAPAPATAPASQQEQQAQP